MSLASFIPEDGSKTGALLHVYILLTTAAILIAVTCLTLVQGILLHLQGQIIVAFGFYFVGWVALGAGLLLFLKGKQQLHTIAIS